MGGPPGRLEGRGEGYAVAWWTDRHKRMTPAMLAGVHKGGSAGEL